MNYYNQKILDLYRLILEEENEIYRKYQSKKELVNNIFSNKYNFTVFINKFICNETDRKFDMLERVAVKLNMDKDNLKEPDFIYKTKDERVYYILEHQTVVDKEIIYRMLNYTISLTKVIKQIKTNSNDSIKLPQIIPIVFYTGEEKWNSPLKIEDIQEEILKENIVLAFKYILININDYTEEDLLSKRCIVSYMMFLEKNRYTNEPTPILDKIFKNCESKKETEETILLVNNFFTPVLGKEITKKLIEKYKKSKNN